MNGLLVQHVAEPADGKGVQSEKAGTLVGDPLADPDRLAALEASGLLAGGRAPSLDRLTALAARLVHVPIALVVVVTPDRQQFPAACGLTGELAATRQTPLSHSYCRLVVEDRAAVIVPDARLDRRLAGNPAIADHGAIAYAGFPLASPDGQILGSFCAMDVRPRRWSAAELSILADLAAAAGSEVALRLAHAELSLSSARMQDVLDGAHDAFLTMDGAGLISAWNLAAERLFGFSAAEAVGREAADLIIPAAQREACRASLPHLAEAGAPALTGDRLTLLTVDRDGREFPVELSVQKSQVRGAPVFHIFLHDISGRVASQELLERQRRDLDDERVFLQALLDSLDAGVAACDGDGRLSLLNRALRDLHGLPSVRSETGNWAKSYDLYGSDGRSLLPADEVPLARAYAGATVQGQEFVVRPVGKPARRLVANGRPIEAADGRRLGAVVAMQDVTESHQAELMRAAQHAVAQALAEATSADRAAAEAVAAIAGTLGWPYGEYWQVADGTLRRCSSHLSPGTDLGGFADRRPSTAGAGEGLAGAAWQRNAEVWAGTATSDGFTAAEQGSALEAGIRTGIAVPVRSDDQVLGVLALFADVELPRDDGVAAVLDAACAHLGRFVERRRAEELTLALAAQQEAAANAVRESERLLAAVAGVARRIRTGEDARTTIMDALRQLADADNVSLFEPVRPAETLVARATPPDTEELVITASVGAPLTGARMPLDGTSMAAHVFRSGEQIFLADPAGDPRVSVALLDRTDARSALWQPVIVNDQVTAVLTTAWKQRVESVGDYRARAVTLLADETALALLHERLLHRLEQMARTDALTGLANRRTWQGELPRLLSDAKRSGRPLTAAIVDLDHFKRYNDTFGHPAGDDLLRRSAAAFAEALRESDLLVRWGGEEFAILLVDCPAADAAEVLDRVRAATPDRETCSIGCATWDFTETGEQLISRADAALYEAKHDGRDRVRQSAGR